MTKKYVLLCLACIISFTFISCNKKVDREVSSVINQTYDTQSITNQTQDVQSVTPTVGVVNESNLPAKPDKKIVKAKGLYLTATSAGERLKHYIDIANTTEINSYVIDFKDDDGWVCFDSKVPLAKEINAIDVRYNAEKVVKELHDNNVYAIARIVCFKDPILAQNKPEIAIKNKDGGLYVHNSKNWVDAYNEKAWKYNLDLAKEAIELGFDEVQFDYVRFPDGKKSEMVFGETNGKNFSENINEFLSVARKQFPNAVLSADVFAIICESPGDTEGIGQHFETIGENMDYLCPMSYPSHYALGQIINGVKFSKPDFEPYNLIKNTFLKAKARLAKVEGHKPVLRAYLQAFTASWIGKNNYQYYGEHQIREQINGVYDAGCEEWFLWDPMNNYKVGAFIKE